MKKILLVDDEEGTQFLYREVLEADGYEVHSALTGEDALQKLKIVSPDLVILDINMPGMNGIEVLRKIKGKKPNMPVILNTGYNEYDQVVGAGVVVDLQRGGALRAVVLALENVVVVAAGDAPVQEVPPISPR